jgi:hypothetical protein
MLRTPTTFAGLARVGPVAKGARMIAAMVADRAFTGLVAVTTAEEMAVTETLSLRDDLDTDGLSLSTVVVNRLHPDRFTPDEVTELERCVADTPEAVQSAVRAAVHAHHRERSESAQVERLGGHAAVPLLALPFLFTNEFGQGALQTLADVLTEAWPAQFTGADGRAGQFRG